MTRHGHQGILFWLLWSGSLVSIVPLVSLVIYLSLLCAFVELRYSRRRSDL
jgi:hypothetical protein